MPADKSDRVARSLSRRTGIGKRLFLAQAMVLAAGAATTWVVAAVVGPPLFREHLHRAGVPDASLEQVHAEEAYGYATVLAMGGALAVSALAALAVSWYASRRLQRSVSEVASAATAVAHGRYDIRVSPPHLDDDFDTLAEAFNQMAVRLQTIDATRRRMFGDLAHEIRTPVSVLEAYMEALEDGVRELTPQTTAMLRDQTHRLVRFSDDIAALAQAEENVSSMAFDWVDPHELVRNTVAAVQKHYCAKKVALTCELSSDLPRLWGDRQRLAQVLGNLLDNALRHTAAAGQVEVRATTVSRDRLALQVSDTGEGIAAEHLPHLFERFYRVDTARDRNHGGAGIGLAIARALTEAHGGRITATSDGPGVGGATFTLTLPIRELQSAHPATSAAAGATRTRTTDCRVSPA